MFIGGGRTSDISAKEYTEGIISVFLFAAGFLVLVGFVSSLFGFSDFSRIAYGSAPIMIAVGILMLVI